MSTSIAKTQRYLPQPLETRFHAVNTYRPGFSVKFVVRRYKISKAFLMRWNRRFDGTIGSLGDRYRYYYCATGCNVAWTS